VLENHRRALIWSVVLAGALLFVLAAVGRHPPSEAPKTTVPFVGEWDQSVFHFMDDIRDSILTGIAKVLSFVGSGVVTIPLRIVVAGWLVFRRHWRALVAWLLTWGFAELALALAKPFFHRGRPPLPLVQTVGYSFPSGHAVAGASIAVALVLVLLPPGSRRRGWEFGAAGFAFAMALSRVYLNAHWFSDVVAGVLLGTSVALGAAAIVTEARDVWVRRASRRARADATSG
jgi:membrane-associated phospholipid phosphatase